LRVVFRPQALEEIESSRDWYDRQQSGLGEAFLAAVEAAIDGIVEHPLIYQRVRGETRRAVLQRFPYGVFYRVLEDEIVVLGVVADRRHPRVWRSRR
jgi:plasmid stabilization system protein ParE